MKQFTLKAGEMVKINGTPITLVEDAVFETHESNMSIIFPTQNEQDKGHEQSSSNKP